MIYSTAKATQVFPTWEEALAYVNASLPKMMFTKAGIRKSRLGVWTVTWYPAYTYGSVSHTNTVMM